MTANEITFGVEIETTIPNGICRVGEYHQGIQVPCLPEGWKAERDGSIRASRGREACEFVSPVLRGSDGIAQLLLVVRKLAEMGARVNASTGLHIHVGWNCDRAALNRLITLVANFEKAIYASTGTHSREENYFSAPIRRFHNAAEAARAARGHHVILNVQHCDSPSSKRTVEFRAFAGTLNATKIIAYVRMCLGLVERAQKAKRVTNWTAKTVKESSPIHRGGEGQTALTRLFYQLGWIKGRTSYVFGDVTADGAPSLAAIRKELMRLAKQYDNPTQVQ